MSTNLTILEGRLTANPKHTITNNNKAATSFTLAVQHNYKDKDGVRGADFIPIVAYDNTAELLATYAQKGTHLNIVGRLTIRQYVQNNEKKYITEVIAEKFSLLGNYLSKSNQNTPVSSNNAKQDTTLLKGQSTQINDDVLPPAPPVDDTYSPF